MDASWPCLLSSPSSHLELPIPRPCDSRVRGGMLPVGGLRGSRPLVGVVIHSLLMDFLAITPLHGYTNPSTVHISWENETEGTPTPPKKKRNKK